MTDQEFGRVLLYRREDGAPALEVRLDADTVWMSQQQIADLFQTSRTNIVEHIRHVYDDDELGQAATCRDFRQVRREGSRQVSREIPHYNLDMIISVGYRVKSIVATQFRIWATNRLRDYLIEGAALNERRLDQLGKLVEIIGRSENELVSGVAEVLTRYAPGLSLLDQYDAARFPAPAGPTPTWLLSHAHARELIDSLATRFPQNTLFGVERGGGMHSVLGAIYQTFDGQDLYPSVQEKAANLLYLVVKDHPLSDGNKRSAAALFVYFLSRNATPKVGNGAQPISNNALAAITLMVAMSDPKEKALMIALVTTMLVQGDRPQS